MLILWPKNSGLTLYFIDANVIFDTFFLFTTDAVTNYHNISDLRQSKYYIIVQS